MCRRGRGQDGGGVGQSVLTPMVAFDRRGGELHCGDVPLATLAERFETPLYVYNLAAVEARVRGFQEAFGELDFVLAYAVKANGNLAVLNRIAGLGAGADIVSGGELQRALRAGIVPERIFFAGVGKRREEMESGIRAGIGAFHVES